MKMKSNAIALAIAAAFVTGAAMESEVLKVDIGFREAEAAGSIPKVEMIEAQILRGDAVTQVVQLEDGRTFELVQVFPTVNKEHVCLVALDPQGAPIRGGHERINELDCFPIKMNPTPTMY